MVIDLYSGKRIRERIPAKLRKQALERAKNTCQYPKCKHKSKYVTLEVHHLNLKNDNNRSSNIKMLCPTHHSIVHHKQSKKYKREQERLRKKIERELKKKKIELKLLEKRKKKMIKSIVLKKKGKTEKRIKKRDIWDVGF